MIMLEAQITLNKTGRQSERSLGASSRSPAGSISGATMKTIPLTKGKFAIVDDEDFDRINKHKWYAHKSRNNFYAEREVRLPGGVRRTIKMHREILGLEYGDKRQCDHKNQNSLDNRRGNLRICTTAQNQQNQKPTINCSSIFKGVSFTKENGKYRALIQVNGRPKHLGYFVSEIEAALAYDVAAKRYYGEYASVNFG